MSKWKLLVLRNSVDRPPLDELVILRIEPEVGPAKYDIGKFQQDRRTGQKLWWYGAVGYHDLVPVKKRNTIWWCPAPKFDPE